MAERRAPRRTYHHGDLRSALLAAATKLIREHGAAGFSLREAARNVGVDAAASYRHFRDRGELLVAIAQEGFLDLANRFASERLRLTGKPARDALVALGRAYLSFAFARPAEFRVMFGDSGLHSRDQRLRLPEVTTSAYEALAEVALAHVREAGLAIEGELLANQLWALAHGVARLTIDGAIVADEATSMRLLESAIGAILQGTPRTTKAESQGASNRRRRA